MQKGSDMAHSIADIARALGLQAEGDLDLIVTHVAEPSSATRDALALAMDPKYADGLTEARPERQFCGQAPIRQGFGLKAAIFAPRPRWRWPASLRSWTPAMHFWAPGHSPKWRFVGPHGPDRGRRRDRPICIGRRTSTDRAGCGGLGRMPPFAEDVVDRRPGLDLCTPAPGSRRAV